MTQDKQFGVNMMISERGLLGGASVALLALGVSSRSALGKAALTGAGAAVGYLALKGQNPVVKALKIETAEEPGEILIREAVTIEKDPQSLYAIWRDLPNLPRLMSNVQSVDVLSATRSKWTVKAPLGQTVSWEAEIAADQAGRRLAWQSVPGSVIDNSGEVLFRPAPGNRGTEVIVRLTYKAPLGSTGAVVARALGKEPAQQIRDDLARFKAEQELGFAPTTNGQTSGRPDAGVALKEESPKAQADQQRAQEGGPA